MARVTTVAAPIAQLVGPGTLKLINNRLAFTTDKGSPLRLDVAALREVHCYGDVGVSGEAMSVLLSHGVEVAWLTHSGTRYRGRLVSSETQATLLRIVQHRVLSQPALQRDWAAILVQAKIDSQLQAARHYQRQGAGVSGDALRRLREAREQCVSATLEQLRGIEGACAATWFRELGGLLREPWKFSERNRRPPRDPVNALLSLGYTMLLSRVAARCSAAGLELNLGGLHEYRPGRPSLACDVMEPLRAPAVDRWVIGVCNQHMLMPEDFSTEEKIGTRLTGGAFSRTMRLWEDWWREQEMDGVLAACVTEHTRWLRASMPELATPSDESP